MELTSYVSYNIVSGFGDCPARCVLNIQYRCSCFAERRRDLIYPTTYNDTRVDTNTHRVGVDGLRRGILRAGHGTNSLSEMSPAGVASVHTPAPNWPVRQRQDLRELDMCVGVHRAHRTVRSAFLCLIPPRLEQRLQGADCGVSCSSAVVLVEVVLWGSILL